MELTEGQLEEGMQVVSDAKDSLLSEQMLISMVLIFLAFAAVKWLSARAKEKKEIALEMDQQFREMEDRLNDAGFDIDGNYIGEDEQQLNMPYERRPVESGTSRMRSARVSSRHVNSRMQYRNDLERYTKETDDEGENG
jgi:hypothetical protein